VFSVVPSVIPTAVEGSRAAFWMRTSQTPSRFAPRRLVWLASPKTGSASLLGCAPPVRRRYCHKQLWLFAVAVCGCCRPVVRVWSRASVEHNACCMAIVLEVCVIDNALFEMR
jgi:hypothetical protein